MYNDYNEYNYRPDILTCIKQRVDAMIAHHCKVLFVRFDLRFPAGTVHHGPNTEISHLMKALTADYTDQGIDAHYIWAREQYSSEAPHYHVVFLLNGSHVQYPMGVWAKAAEFWSHITGGPHALVHQCRETSGMIRRPSGRATGEQLLAQQQAYQRDYNAALEWGAYLAKGFSKGSAPHRVREYGASRLEPR